MFDWISVIDAFTMFSMDFHTANHPDHNLHWSLSVSKEVPVCVACIIEILSDETTLAGRKERALQVEDFNL